MTSYNDSIVINVMNYIKYLAERLGSLDNKHRKVILEKYVVLETGNVDINQLMTENLTGEFIIDLRFVVYDENNNLILFDEGEGSVPYLDRELRIPKLINGLFVIDGNIRTTTSTLDNDYRCRVYGSRIVIDNDMSFSFEEMDNNSIKITAYLLDDNDEPIELDVTSEDDLAEFKQFLKLDDYCKKKLKVKLDTDNIGDYVTYDLIMDLYKLGSDQQVDSIIDKQITTVGKNLMQTLYRSSTRSKILTSMRRKFYASGLIYLTDIQLAITRYFKVANESNVDIPTGINPLVFDSLKYKIVFPKYLAYNSTYSDLIDPVNTPENANVNRLNELNICASIRDGEIYITCYDIKTGDKKKLLYLDYLNEKVLVNSCYDYDTKKPLTGITYYYKLRLKTYEVKSLTGLNINLVEPAPDEKLSITTRRIPLINMSDTVRVAMGATMSKQALELEQNETPLVATGNDDIDYLDSSLITTYDGSDAVVDSVEDNKIFVRDKVTDSIDYIQITSDTKSINDSLITFDPLVKPGDTLKKGDVVIAPKIMKNNSYNLGINATAFLMSYLGYTYEDGIVISESFANKLIHYTRVDLSFDVRPKDTISYIKKIGSKVQSKDILINCSSDLRVHQDLKNTYVDPKGLMNFMELKKSRNNLICPNNVDEGYIVDVKIVENKNNESVSDYTKSYINEYKKDSINRNSIDLPEKYKRMRCESNKVTSDRFSYTVYMKIIKINRAIVGSKLCNRWGSKGEVSLIIPDHLMPRIDSDGNGNGLIPDIILNQNSIIPRKNPSQLYEMILSKVINKIYTLIGEKLANNDVKSAKLITQPYYGTKFINMTDKEFISRYSKGKSFLKMDVGSYAKVTYDQVLKWMKDLNLSDSDPVYAPSIIIDQNRKVHDPKSYKPTPGVKYESYDLGFLESEVITGITYMMKLYHSSDYSGKVTSSITDSSEPYMGRGIYRSEGQKIGEMEKWALLAYGTQSMMDADNSDIVKSQYILLNEFLLAGFAVVDESGVPYLSEYKQKLKNLIDLHSK